MESKMKDGVIQRGKTWSYVLRITDPNTLKKKQKWVSGFLTRQDAVDALETAKAQLTLNLYRDNKSKPFGRYIDDWFENIHKPTLKPSTARGYEVNIRLHIKPYIGQIPLCDIRRNDIVKLYNRLLAKGLKPSTIRYVHNTLRKALNDAVANDDIPKNPCSNVKLPKISRYKAVVLTQEQLCKLLEAAKTTPIFTEILLAVTLGLRRGEVLGLQFRDFDYDEKIVAIRRQIGVIDAGKGSAAESSEWGVTTPKTEDSVRELYVPASVIEYVKKLEQERQVYHLSHAKNDGFVCCGQNGSFKNPEMVYLHFKRLLRSQGLPEAMRFHDLRHSYASNMIEAGLPLKTVSHILGHSSIGITADIYCDVINKHKEAAEVVENSYMSVLGTI